MLDNRFLTRGEKLQRLNLNLKKLWRLVLGKTMKLNPNKGIKVIETKWDTLIVLDACRYDYFKRLNPFKGRLFKVQSKAANTFLWLQRNFDEFYPDIIYVSANPLVARTTIKGFSASNHFGYVKEVWNWGWDEKLNSVHPATVTDSAIKLRKEFSGWRMIVHYIQPHYPYIGKNKLITRWQLIESNLIPSRYVRKAYESNLKLVLEQVARLIRNIHGRTVITSDHGELLGEWGIYGHKFGYLGLPELVHIPWFIYHTNS